MRKRAIVSFLVLALVLTGLVLFGCPIYKIFGVPCPACGVTRAWLCLFRGDVAGAFRHHLFFFAVPFYLVLFVLVDNDLCGRLARAAKTALYAGAGVLFLYYCIRLGNGSIK